MKSVAEDVATYLAAQMTGWTLGTNVMAGILTDLPDTQIAVLDAPGLPRLRMQSAAHSDTLKPGCQVRVRCKGGAGAYQSGYAIAKVVETTLRAANNVTWNSGTAHQTFYGAFFQRGAILSLGQDDETRSEFSLSYVVVRSDDVR